MAVQQRKLSKCCIKCGENKSLDQFSASLKGADGYRRDCRECHRKVSKAWKENHKEEQKQYRQRFNKTPKRREDLRRYSKQHYIKNPEKIAARQKLAGAVLYGKIKRMPCVICGNPKSQGHHEDYTKPYNVVWFCKIHHEEHHKKKKSERSIPKPRRK